MADRYGRGISTVVLSLFIWTFGGVFDIAWAVRNDVQSSSTSKTSDNSKTGSNKPEEKLQKALEEIETIIADTSTDTDTKKKKVKNKKSDIETIDSDIKKQFSDTEAKIKDLPSEILQRHTDFVKKYENNLKELKTDIDNIQAAKNSSEAETHLSNLKEFIAKTKAPRKKSNLDPTKLPHRTEEPVFTEPRTTPEEFQAQTAQASARKKKKPLMVASSGSLKGLLSPASKYETKSSGLLPKGSYQIAMSIPPTSSDLSEDGVEIRFTDAIKAKAAELNNNPVSIYNWVRNNIEYVPTYGSIQGADMCLQTKQCNDMDTASLLIALLRASGVHARYVYGTIQLPIDTVRNWAGGFTNSMEALRLFASAGVPTKGLTEGGQIKYARVEHMWVEAYIDYFPSRGAKHKTGQGDMWVPLDASFKQYSYTQGLDIKSAVPFDAQSFIDQVKSSATINEASGYVTNVSSTLISQTMQDYQTQAQNYISQNYPNATVGDVLGKKDIVKQEFPYLLGTTPYSVVVRGATYSGMPSGYRHSLTFNVTKDSFDEIMGTPLSITKSLPELAGKKITLSYSPATSSDVAVINSYLPKAHTDGTPIDPSELPSSLPAYLINLKPELRVDGVVVATGTTVGMGNIETFTMTFAGPGTNANEVITNDVTAGNYLGIGLDLARVSQDQMTAIKTKLEDTKAKLEAQSYDGLTKDDLLGDLLYTTAISYYAELDVMDFVTSRTMGVAALRLPSENIFSSELKVKTFFGAPFSASSGGLAMDVDRVISLVKAFDADANKPVQFMLASGVNSSALEHSVPEQLFSTTDNPAYGISAVKALQLANDQGIPIYTIDQTNIDTVIPQLQLDSGTISDIENAVNAGNTVTVSQSDITYQGWTGCGYIVLDPTTGAGAYMISGGMNGSFVVIAALISFFIAFAILVSTACGPLSLLLGGVLLITGMVRYIDAINKIISLMNIGVITSERADDLIKARSIGTIVSSLLTYLGKDSEFKLAGSILVAVFQLIMDGIQAMFIEAEGWNTN